MDPETESFFANANNQVLIALQRMNAAIEQQLTDLANRHQANHEQLVEMIRVLTVQMSDISTGRVPLQINMNWSQNSNIPTVSTQTVLVPLSQPETIQDGAVDSTSTPSTTTTTSDSTASHHVQYRLSRELNGLDELWREWSQKLYGNYPIQWYEENLPYWYDGDKNFYMRRKRIITKIQEYAQVEVLSMEEAIQRAEKIRVCNRRILDYLSKNVDKIFTME
ncbi:unnamed protein product [Mucor hiemalis]